MVTDLSPLEWVRFALALLLFMGPGYAVLSNGYGRSPWDKTQTVAIALPLSLAVWSIFLAWLHGMGMTLSAGGAGVLLGSGWILGIWARRPTRSHDIGGQLASDSLSRAALWGILVLTAGVALWTLRGVVVGPGSDSYHHTLITHMIVQQGTIPNSLEPVAPIATFTYHFGFHGFAAAVAWVTGIEPRRLVPLLEQILTASAALSVAFMAEILTGRRQAAPIAAAAAGLISVFPAYLINWGRATQLGGLVILPVFLALVWKWMDDGYPWSWVPLISLLAAGMALVHYRVALMAAAGVLVFLLTRGLRPILRWPRARRDVGGCVKDRGAIPVGQLALAALLAGVAILPWAWHVFQARYRGYPIDLGIPAAPYFALERLGAGVLQYPTNLAIGLVVVAVILGWWRRNQVIIALTLWTVLMAAASDPHLAGIFMDRISVVISLYIPASVAIAWMGTVLLDWPGTAGRLLGWGVMTGLAALGIRGAIAIASIVEPNAAYVGPDDLRAMEWIRTHTPISAYFMVNTYHWDWLPDFVVGSDAGYWIPLLANRRTITAPMIYGNERSSRPDFVDRLVALDRLGGSLTSPAAVALLQQEGITHVYIGQRGGPISPEDLLASPAFQLEYRSGAAYVFRFLGPPGLTR